MSVSLEMWKRAGCKCAECGRGIRRGNAVVQSYTTPRIAHRACAVKKVHTLTHTAPSADTDGGSIIDHTYEKLVFDRTLTAEEMARVWRYFAEKWGVT